MSDRKPKASKQIQADVGELRDRLEAQGNEIATLRRRVDRIEKSTHLVLENTARVEELFAAAEAMREFKSLASNTAMAVLREIHAIARLPVPLPEILPETWRASAAENATVAPNQTRSTRDSVPQVTSWSGWSSVKRRCVFNNACRGHWVNGSVGLSRRRARRGRPRSTSTLTKRRRKLSES